MHRPQRRSPQRPPTPPPNCAATTNTPSASAPGKVGESFLKTHATGFYADLARAQLSKLNADKASTSAAERAKKAAEEKARLAKEGAAPADQAKADAEAKAAQKAKLNAESARKREQALVAAAERKKRQQEARIAAQSKAVSLPAQGAGAGWQGAPQRAQQPKPAARMDRAALWAKCEAMMPRTGGRDDDLTRPSRIEYCANNGGNR